MYVCLIELSWIEFHSNFQDIAHLIESEEARTARSETPLKIKLNFKPRKNEAYAKLEESTPSPEIIVGGHNLTKRPEILLACTSCKNKADELNDVSKKKEQKKPKNQMNTFCDLPKNVCDGIETKFDDLGESVCKSLPTDTFDDIPQNTFDDIELAIDEN